MILRTTIGAFLLGEDTAAAVEALRGHRLFLRSTLNIQAGGIAAAVAFLREHEAPPILIVETEATGDGFYGELDQLAEVVTPSSRVFLIGRDNDIRLYRELIREGLSDYMVAPVTSEMLLQSFSEIFQDKDATNKGRTIAFRGTRGGVGSSIISHHVAYALADLYQSHTILLDLDITHGTSALVYNQQPRQTVIDALTQSSRLDDTLLDRLLIEVTKKLSILPAPASLATGLTPNVEAIGSLLKVSRSLADFVVLDLPPSWEAWVRELLVEADDLVIIAEPDLASLRDSKNLVEFLGPNRGIEVPTRLVLNKVGANKKTELTHKEFQDALALTPSLEIPADPASFGLALNNGELLFKAAPKSKVCETIHQLAKLVSGREAVAPKEKKGFSLFKLGK